LLEVHRQVGFAPRMTSDDNELVDVLCIGAGLAGFAAAVAAADAGQTVFVAEQRRRTSRTEQVEEPETWAEVIRRHWGVEDIDEPTAEYLHKLTCDLDPPRRSTVHGELPIGSVDSFDEATFDPRKPVPPFYGHEMADWANDCLTSPYGLIFSRLTPVPMTQMRMQDGAMVRAGVVSEIPRARRSGVTLRQWLEDMAKERGVTVQGSAVQRLIFSDGHPIGAVLETADGIREVRARSGVLMGTSNTTTDDVIARYPASVLREGRLSLVSRSASRFARLELLTTAAAMSVCAPEGRLA
jgi:hypothetical protein